MISAPVRRIAVRTVFRAGFPGYIAAGIAVSRAKRLVFAQSEGLTVREKAIEIQSRRIYGQGKRKTARFPLHGIGCAAVLSVLFKEKGAIACVRFCKKAHGLIAFHPARDAFIFFF